jgi:hypothetical protein
MTLPPRWFYRTVEPQVAEYIGQDAAALRLYADLTNAVGSPCNQASAQAGEAPLI